MHLMSREEPKTKLRFPATLQLRNPEAISPAALMLVSEATASKEMATMASDLDIRGMTNSLLQIWLKQQNLLPKFDARPEKGEPRKLHSSGNVARHQISERWTRLRQPIENYVKSTPDTIGPWSYGTPSCALF